MRIHFCELNKLTFSIKRERYIGNGLSIKRVPSYIGRIIDEDRGFTVSSVNSRWMIFGAPRRDFANAEEWTIGNAIRHLISALLICCGENVEPGAVYHCDYDGRNRADKVMKMYGGVHNEKSVGFDQSDIASEQLAYLRRLFSKLMKVADTDFIRMPLSFYREACVFHTLSWKIVVYLIIALESIFLTGESNKALMLAKRAASFLASNKQQKEDIYHQVFALYKCRNAVVHDGNSSPSIKVTDPITDTRHSYNITDLTKCGYDICRRSIRRILDKNILDRQSLLHSIHQRSGDFHWSSLKAKIVNT